MGTGCRDHGTAENPALDIRLGGLQSDRYSCALRILTGEIVDPMMFPRSVLGLQTYFNSFGLSIRNFSAFEFVQYLGKPEVKQRTDIPWFDDPLSGRVLLPGRYCYPRIALIAVVLQRTRDALRRVLGSKAAPIKVLHTWRPAELNRLHGGAPRSDHLSCCASDIFLTSRAAQRVALDAVIWPLYRADLLGMSVGYNSAGSRRLHLGFWAPETLAKGRQRQWDYAKP